MGGSGDEITELANKLLEAKYTKRFSGAGVEPSKIGNVVHVDDVMDKLFTQAREEGIQPLTKKERLKRSMKKNKMRLAVIGILVVLFIIVLSVVIAHYKSNATVTVNGSKRNLQGMQNQTDSEKLQSMDSTLNNNLIKLMTATKKNSTEKLKSGLAGWK